MKVDFAPPPSRGLFTMNLLIVLSFHDRPNYYVPLKLECRLYTHPLPSLWHLT